jgi:hypothetical protein
MGTSIVSDFFDFKRSKQDFALSLAKIARQNHLDLAACFHWAFFFPDASLCPFPAT